MAIKTNNLYSVDSHCNQCKGKCWNQNDQSKTQKAAREMFGFIPNKCVNGEGGIVHCPATKGLIK